MLSEILKAENNYRAAQALDQRSLAINEKVLGSEHPAVATSVLNLAELQRAQGHGAEAEPLYKRSLAIREAKFGGQPCNGVESSGKRM